MTSTIADHWNELVTGALLGTDRRDPPAPPHGPLADVVADSAVASPSARMLVSVAASTAVRRAALRPLAAADPLAPPEQDDRRMVGPAAARRWRTIVSEWPVLEDEWLATVERSGQRLPPDVLVGLLRRHRGDAARRAQVVELGGPLATWLVELQPQLAAPNGRAAPARPAGVPPLPVPPTLQALLTSPGDDVIPVIVAALRDGTFAAAHRAVLVNFVARMRPDALQSLAEALRAATTGTGAAGLMHLVADLAETRHAMLQELSV